MAAMHQDVENEAGEYDPAKLARKLHEINTAIGRARMRQQLAQAAGDTRTAIIEEGVMDRRLAERFEVTR